MLCGFGKAIMKVQKAALPILFSILLSSCSVGNPATPVDKPAEGELYLMGTTIQQKVYGPEAEKAIAETGTRIKEIEGLMTINMPGGDINRLNEAAGKDEVVLSPETVNILDTAKRYAALSDGAFDVTVGPLVKAWGVFTDHPRIPPQDEINKLMKLVDYRKLTIDRAKSTARLDLPGQVVDLGGIAKGYAGDQAIKIYKSHNIKSAYINLGGNVVVLGSKPDGSPWRIGIQNPRAANGLYIGIVNVKDKAVVTSGDYERYFERNNIRYHHIIDTKTGYPADSGLMSSTIITDVSMDADALSTATFVLGLDKGMKLVKDLKGVEAIFITKDKKIYVTEGLKNSFTFDDESKEYEYAEKG